MSHARLSVDASTAEAAEASGRCRAALLVEDEVVYQDLIRAAFADPRLSGALRVVDSGADALEALRDPAASFDIVLVDLGLPDVSGLEVIRAARELHPDTPVMVASIHSDQSHVLDAIRAGARGYLLKDDSAIGISEAILRVIEGEFPISPSLARYLFRLAAIESEAVPPGSLALARKERELLALLAQGASYKKAAQAMGVSVSTVQTYVRRVYQKLEAHSKIEAIDKARRMGLL